MARISYLAIARKIKETLENDPDIAAAARTITVAEDNIAAAELMPWVCIYPISRRPTTGQSLAANTRWRFEIMYEIWAYGFSMLGPEDALQQCEDLLGMIEVALLRDPTLGGLAQMQRLDGGDFDNAKTEGSFVMGGSVRLAVQAVTTTR